MTTAMPPEGFVPAAGSDHSTFEAVVAPILWRDEPGGPAFAFLPQPVHANRRGAVHGGLLVAFMDEISVLTARHALGAHQFYPTVTLSCSYVAAASVGNWVEGRVRIVKATRSTVFVQGEATTAGEPLATVSGTLRIIAPRS